MNVHQNRAIGPGFGSSGQLGQGTNSSIGNAPNTMGDNLPAVNLGTGRTAVALSLGATHSCAGMWGLVYSLLVGSVDPHYRNLLATTKLRASCIT